MAKPISHEPRRLATALPISTTFAQCLLDRAVSPVSHAESPPVVGSVVVQGWLCESVRREPPFESLERIVSLEKSEDSCLPCCSQTSPHSRRLRCHSFQFRQFP